MTGKSALTNLIRSQSEVLLAMMNLDVSVSAGTKWSAGI